MVSNRHKPEGAKFVYGPPAFNFFDHVSLPCRDLEEGMRFYSEVMGGEFILRDPTFALYRIAGTKIGIGTDGATFMPDNVEYPHVAFNLGADELVQMREWLIACGIPVSDYWTRSGVETLMYFRDPSGNVLELYCTSGFEDAPNLARGPARGHGNTLDIDALRYAEWHLPGDTA